MSIALRCWVLLLSFSLSLIVFLLTLLLLLVFWFCCCSYWLVNFNTGQYVTMPLTMSMLLSLVLISLNLVVDNVEFDFNASFDVGADVAASTCDGEIVVESLWSHARRAPRETRETVQLQGGARSRKRGLHARLW